MSTIVKNLYVNVKTTAPRDDYFTPPEAVYPILDFIEKDKKIWEPTSVPDGNISSILQTAGHEIIETSFDDGFNFLTDKPDFDFDIIITNPPFSLKTEFIARCYEIGKPFMLLLPSESVNGTKRQEYYRKHGIKLILFNRRLNYIKKEAKTGSWFGSAWFCWKIDKIQNELNFIDIIKK